MSYAESDSNFTTYSADQRIESKRRRERIQEEEYEKLVQKEREKFFKKIYKEKAHQVFRLPGVNFLRVCSRKIKFSFRPCTVIKLISKKTVFYCSLIYSKKWMWMIKRDSFPSNYKVKIYNTFNDDNCCLISDEDVLARIQIMYKHLLIWASKYEKVKEEKYHKFKRGENVELDEEEEELFLSPKERNELVEKRKRILRRMIPPDGPRNWRID